MIKVLARFLQDATRCMLSEVENIENSLSLSARPLSQSGLPTPKAPPALSRTY